MQNPQLATYHDVARALKCSTRHIENLVNRDPDFPVVRLGKSVRFSLDDVINYLKEQSRRSPETVGHDQPEDLLS